MYFHFLKSSLMEVTLMKKMILLLSLLALLALPVAASGPATDADQLWEYITKVDPYNKWENWPDHKGMQEGVAPHGPLHEVFVNTAGLKKAGWPKTDGTIVVKENFSPDKKLAAITVMYKRKGYNPEAGDWYWVKYSPDGKAAKAGKPAGCIGCHSARAEMDYIMVSDH